MKATDQNVWSSNKIVPYTLNVAGAYISISKSEPILISLYFARNMLGAVIYWNVETNT